MRPLGAINIPHQALKCQDVSTQWSLRHLNSFAQELLNEFRYIFRKKKEIEQTKVSIPSLWQWVISTQYLRLLGVHTLHQFLHSPSQRTSHLLSLRWGCARPTKNTQKTWQSWILRQTTSLLHLNENIFSAEEMLSQFQTSTTDIHDMCSYCCRGKPREAACAAQAKEEESKEQARQGVIIDSFLF